MVALTVFSAGFGFGCGRSRASGRFQVWSRCCCGRGRLRSAAVALGLGRFGCGLEQFREGAGEPLQQAARSGGGRRGCGCSGRCRGCRCNGAHGRLLAWPALLAALLFELFEQDLGRFVVGSFDRFTLPQPFEAEQRGLQVGVGDDAQADFAALLDLQQVVALLVEQVGGDRHRHDGANFGAAALGGLLLEDAHDRQRQRLHAADRALPVAARAGDVAGLLDRRAQPLAGHLQQSETGDAPHLDARAVHLQCLAHPVLDLFLVARRAHVDEVDDDQTADVPQPQLAGDLVGGFQVGLQCGLFDVRATGGTRRVDVDRDQRLGRVDHHHAAGGQLHFTLIDHLDLAFDLIAGEQRNGIAIELDVRLVLRHHLADEGAGFLIGLLRVDQHFADVGAQVVAHRTHDHIALLIDQKRRWPLRACLGDRLPQLHQVVEVGLQLIQAAADAGGAHDDAHAFGQIELAHDLAQFGALFTLDAAGDAAAARVVRHQHQIAAGQADEGAECGALGAPLLLLDLNDDLVALFQAGVVARDLLQRQKAVPLGAEIDKGCLEAGLDPGDSALVDVGLGLLPRAVLDVQVVEFLPINEGDAQLLGVGRIDQNSFHGDFRLFGEFVQSKTAGRVGCRPATSLRRIHGGSTASTWVAARAMQARVQSVGQ